MRERGSLMAILFLFVVLAFNLGCPGNRPPVIESLTADPSAVEPYDTTKVTCEAYDPDGDELTYTWRWSNGIADTVDTDTINYLLWVAPKDTGLYEIEVMVSDGIATIGPSKTTVKVGNLPPPAVKLYEPEELADSALILTWSKSQARDFLTYEVHRSQTPDFIPSSATVVDTIFKRDDTTYTITGLTIGTVYRLAVVVRDTAGFTTKSNEVVGILANLPPASVVLNPPTRITASSLVLTWSQNLDRDFESYQIHGSTQVGFTPSAATLITTISSRVDTLYTVEGLDQSTTYYFLVVVRDAGGLESRSNEVSATTLNAPPEAVTLAPPTEITNSSVRLAWTKSREADFARYEVHRSPTPDFSPSGATNVANIAIQTDTAYTVAGLEPGQGYYFAVAVVDTGGLSTKSNEVSARTLPHHVKGDCDIPGRGVAVDFWSLYAFAAALDRGVQIISVADPKSPAVIGYWDSLSVRHVQYARDIKVSYPRAYVAFSDSGLQVFDITLPSTPRRIGGLTAVRTAHSLFVSDNRVYVGNEQRELWVVDAATLTTLGADTLPGQPLDIHVSGTHAYTAASYTGLVVVNVADPANPFWVTSFFLPGEAHGVFVSGRYAYVAAKGAGLHIIDIARPESPTLLGTCDTPGEAREVYVQGTQAFVADWHGGLQVVDVSDPRNPRLVSFCEIPGGFISDVYVGGAYAYLTDLNGRFYVIGW